MTAPLDDVVPPASHPELALAPAYALGALDVDEGAAFEAHLPECAACRAEVREHAEVAALLARALPAAAPAPALRARILADATGARAAAPPEAVGPAVVPLDAARTGRTTSPPVAGARRATRSRDAWPGWLAAAALLLLAAGLGTGWRGERAARRAAESALAAGRDSLAGDRAALAARDALLATVLAPEVRTARLVATGAGPEVRVVWNRRAGVVVLTAAALAPAPAGRTYQLWGIAGGGAPRSLGTFDADAQGQARLVARVPSALAIDVAAISVEPDGGSPAPTTAPVLAGPLRSE